MSVRSGSQVMPEGMKHFPISASKLSDAMDPKSNKASFDAVGGSVEAVVKALNTDLVNGISGDETDIKNRMEHFGGYVVLRCLEPVAMKFKIPFCDTKPHAYQPLH